MLGGRGSGLRRGRRSWAQALFRGETTDVLWVSLPRNVEKNVKGVHRFLELLGDKNWSSVCVLLLDSDKKSLLEHTRALGKAFHLNLPAVMVTDCVVVSMGMQTPWFVWMMDFRPKSVATVKPLVMKTTKLFQRGVNRSEDNFHDPDLPADIFVLQAHVSWLPELYQFLLRTSPRAMKFLEVTTSILSTFSCNGTRLK